MSTSDADLAWGAWMVRTMLKRKRLREAAHEQEDHSLCRPGTCEDAAAAHEQGDHRRCRRGGEHHCPHAKL